MFVGYRHPCCRQPFDSRLVDVFECATGQANVRGCRVPVRDGDEGGGDDPDLRRELRVEAAEDDLRRGQDPPRGRKVSRCVGLAVALQRCAPIQQPP